MRHCKIQEVIMRAGPDYEPTAQDRAAAAAAGRRGLLWYQPPPPSPKAGSTGPFVQIAASMRGAYFINEVRRIAERERLQREINIHNAIAILGA